MQEHSGQRNTQINNTKVHFDILIVIKDTRLLLYYSEPRFVYIRLIRDAQIKIVRKLNKHKIDDPKFQNVVPHTAKTIYALY